MCDFCMASCLVGQSGYLGGHCPPCLCLDLALVRVCACDRACVGGERDIMNPSNSSQLSFSEIHF